MPHFRPVIKKHMCQFYWEVGGIIIIHLQLGFRLKLDYPFHFVFETLQIDIYKDKK